MELEILKIMRIHAKEYVKCLTGLMTFIAVAPPRIQ